MNRLCFIEKKTKTSVISRSRSKDLPIGQNHEGNHGEREEFFHFRHPHHPLVPVTSPYLFTCMGCKEYGAGKKFTCHSCYFDLHDFCAMAPPSLQGHPFGNKHHLVFMTKSGGGFLRSNCDICEKTAKGYTFRCTTCNFEMHPSCSLLLSEMTFPSHPHALKLTFASTSTICRICMRRRSGCVYHCITCDYSLHAVCAKNMVNGLHVNGIQPPEKANRLGKAAKVASHAFLGFLGGLIEGIGEGIGDALIESIGRSRRSNRSNIMNR